VIRAVIALCLALASCAPAKSPTPAVTTLSLMLPPAERPFWEPIARSFEAAHSNVRVDLIEGPQSTDLRRDLHTAALLARDPSFDLVYMDVTWTATFAAAGWLRPLDVEFDAERRAEFLTAAIDAGVHEGKLYRVPMRTDMGLLYYRRDWLDSLRLAEPQTFEDLLATAAAVDDPPRRWGFVWPGKQYEGLVCIYLEVLHGYGGNWIDPESREVGLDRPEALAALEFLMRCIDSGVSPPGVTTYQEEESRRLFADGRAAFLRNWPYVWRISQREESAIRGRVGVTNMVGVEPERRAGTLGGWGLGVSTWSRHPELAIEFIRHATSLEAQRLFCAPTGYAPALIASYADTALIAANPFLEPLLEWHQRAVPRPLVPEYAQTSDVLQRYLSAALTHSLSPRDALERAARETRRLLRSRVGGPA
jgi:multiple sugar transport system substrate-binding protein